MLLQYLNKGVVEAGCDEAGRGCLAGPVFAAAVGFRGEDGCVDSVVEDEFRDIDARPGYLFAIGSLAPAGREYAYNCVVVNDFQ